MLRTINYRETRKKYFTNQNYRFNINKRLKWIKKFINKNTKVIEIGSGSGIIKKIINKNVVTTDIIKNQYIDYILDMNVEVIPKKFINNFDIIIFNHSLHHSNNPIKVLKKLKIMLKKNGIIIINEPEASLIFKLFLFIFNHEKFDENMKNKKKKNFWTQNNSTGKILFQDKKINKIFLKDFIILQNELSEFLIFLNSSGGGINTPYLKLNKFFLKFFDNLDNFLIKFFPQIFALNRTVILKKFK